MDKNLTLFDCDGVLVDSEHIACRIEAEVLNEMGCPIQPEEGVALLAGKSPMFVEEHAENVWGKTLPANYHEITLERTKLAFNQQLKSIHQVESVLDAVNPKCLVSNGQLDKIENSLRLSGLKRYFPDTHIFHVDLVKHGKPAPDLYLLAAKTMGYAPEACIVVEDSVSGVQAAIAANMTVYGFSGGTHVLDKKAHAALLKAHGAKDVYETMAQVKMVLRQC